MCPLNFIQIIRIVLVIIALWSPLIADESAITILLRDGGSRQNGMGEVGTALVLDESSLFRNPAGLSRNNPRITSGAASFSYEALLPKAEIDNLWFISSALAYKPERKNYGFGLGVRASGMPLNDKNISGSNASIIINLAHSFNLDKWYPGRHFLGYSAHYVQLRYDAHREFDRDSMRFVIIDSSEYYQRGMVFDVGYLLQIDKHLRFGVTLANMGPNSFPTGIAPSAPFPFCIDLALASSNSFGFFGGMQLNSEVRLWRDFINTDPVTNRPDPLFIALVTDVRDKSVGENIERITLHIGTELLWRSLIALRVGYLHDQWGLRRELHCGLGANILNHIGLDFYAILSPETNTNPGIRNGQFGVTASFHGLFRSRAI